MAKAAKKNDRIAAEGLAGVAIDGNTAAIVEVNSETDFVASNDQFKALLKDMLKQLLKTNQLTWLLLKNYQWVKAQLLAQ